jgi:hypothetical protein
VIRASDFAAKVEQHREVVPMSHPGELAFDPHDPAFADIFEGFIQAEKSQKRFPNQVQPEEVTTWVERLYGEDLNQAQRAARWLGQYGGQEVLALLRDALTHNDVRVRTAALLALAIVRPCPTSATGWHTTPAPWPAWPPRRAWAVSVIARSKTPWRPLPKPILKARSARPREPLWTKSGPLEGRKQNDECRTEVILHSSFRLVVDCAA